jgi:hypothetical protein
VQAYAGAASPHPLEGDMETTVVIVMAVVLSWMGAAICRRFR